MTRLSFESAHSNISTNTLEHSKKSQVSEETRLHAIELVYHRHYQRTDVSRMLGINYSTLKTICQVYEKYGRSKALPRGGAHNTHFSPENQISVADFVKSKKTERPGISFRELRQQILSDLGITISQSKMRQFVDAVYPGFLLKLKERRMTETRPQRLASPHQYDAESETHFIDKEIQCDFDDTFVYLTAASEAQELMNNVGVDCEPGSD